MIDLREGRPHHGAVAALGADVIVTGSAVFGGGSPLENSRSMLAAARGAADGAEGPPRDDDKGPVVLAGLDPEGGAA